MKKIYCGKCKKYYYTTTNNNICPYCRMRKIRITTIELIFCPKENEIIQFDKKCTECKHFNGYYSATGYIECNL